MNKTLAAIAGAACLMCTSLAHATAFKVDFSVSGFGPGIFSGSTAPQSTVVILPRYYRTQPIA